MLVSTKSYYNYSCAHRQWKDDGHCKLIHGYDRSFHFWFAAKEVTETNFVMHFGQLKELKSWLDDKFDHTLLINEDDPMMFDFEQLAEKGAAKLTILPNVGMEGTSQYIWMAVNLWLKAITHERVCCFKVETREHEKNSAYFEQWPEWFPKESAC